MAHHMFGFKIRPKGLLISCPNDQLDGLRDIEINFGTAEAIMVIKAVVEAWALDRLSVVYLPQATILIPAGQGLRMALELLPQGSALWQILNTLEDVPGFPLVAKEFFAPRLEADLDRLLAEAFPVQPGA